VVGELRSAEDPSGYRVQELLVALGTGDELDVLQPSGGWTPRDEAGADVFEEMESGPAEAKDAASGDKIYNA
jgi:hypothetical protein